MLCSNSHVGWMRPRLSLCVSMLCSSANHSLFSDLIEIVASLVLCGSASLSWSCPFRIPLVLAARCRPCRCRTFCCYPFAVGPQVFCCRTASQGMCRVAWHPVLSVALLAVCAVVAVPLGRRSSRPVDWHILLVRGSLRCRLQETHTTEYTRPCCSVAGVGRPESACRCP